MLSKTEAGADKGSVAAGGSIKDTTISIGATAEELLDRLEQAKQQEGRFQLLLEQREDKVAELGAALEVTEKAVLGFLKILGEQEIAKDQIEPTLRQVAERHVELTEQLRQLSKSGEEPEIIKRRKQAAKAIEEGDYDQAAELLEQATNFDRQAIIHQQDALDRRKLSAAVTLSQQGELEHTRLNYRKAVEHFAHAASLTSDADASATYLTKQAAALYAQGKIVGENDALVEAIAIYRNLLERRPRERAPLDWAATQNGLGLALRGLGRREAGTKLLNEAIEAFQHALSEYKRDRAPLEWAKTQDHLGLALRSLGERELGTARFMEAANAFRAALDECPQDKRPFEWAMIQMNLAGTLGLIGQRRAERECLLEAIDIYRQVLEQLPREREPFQWARTQSNLGYILQILGELESDEVRLNEALARLRGSLEERPRSRIPLDWGVTQTNIGLTLKSLGYLHGDPAQLLEAATAFCSALEVRAPDRAPFQWALTQTSLGATHMHLGELGDDDARIDRAIGTFRAALQMQTPERVPYDWSTTQINLGTALQMMGERRQERSYFESALQVFDETFAILKGQEGESHREAYLKTRIETLEAVIGSERKDG